MSNPSYVLVTCGDASIDDVEAFGPFTSADRAEKLRARHEEAGVRPAYPLEVVELLPVGELLGQVLQEEERNAREGL